MRYEAEMREALCEVGRRVWKREYIASNDGNFSVRLDGDRILATPTMVSKGFMKPEELPVVTLDGQQLSGPLRVTSEVKAHLEIYRVRPDVRAVVHVHPPHATAFAVARKPLPKCILPEIELFLGEIPLTSYATPGTDEFAATLRPFLANHNAFVLTNHGALTVGSDPFECYYRMETLEQYCRILLLAANLGGWQQISEVQALELLQLREKLGVVDRRLEAGECLCSTGVPPSQSVVNQRTDTDQMESLIEDITARVLEAIRQT
jgi:L-fuculose-phosphate aldolase